MDDSVTVVMFGSIVKKKNKKRRNTQSHSLTLYVNYMKGMRLCSNWKY